MAMRKFRYAGVSKVDGRLALRASNRENYDEILVRDKNTAINIIALDKPMTKDQIREHLARRKDFKTPAILKLLKGDDAPKVAKAPAAKKSKVRKTRKPAAVTEVANAA